MKYVIHDKKHHFKFAFDSETGTYVRTGILDENGNDTGVDPFMASYPHLIDVGIMGHCIHGKTGLCSKAGITPSTVYSLFDESRHNVSITTIKILCDGLEMSLGEFFSSEEFDSLEQEIE